MRKFFTSLFIIFALTAVASPDAAQIYRSTTRYVDFDGNALFYYNTTELLKYWQQLPSVFAPVVLKFVDAPHDRIIPLVKDGADILNKTLNLQALKAVAGSSKRLKNGLFVNKLFLYVGNDVNQPGAFNYSNFANDITIEQFLTSLPEDVILANMFQLTPGDFYAELDKNINTSTNQELLMAYNMLKISLVSMGIDPVKLSASANGKYLLFIAGNSPESFRFSLVIPDSTGNISAALKQAFPPATATPDRSMLPAQHGMNPALLYLDKSIVLVSDFDRCTKIYKSFGIPESFRRLVPAKAGAYGVINISQQLIDNMQTIIPNDKEVRGVLMKLLFGIKPGLSVHATTVERDGARIIDIADFSIEDAYYKFLMRTAYIR